MLNPISSYCNVHNPGLFCPVKKSFERGYTRGYEEKLTREMNEAIDQLMEDFDGERYLRTEPVGFYQYLADLYMGMKVYEKM